MTKKTLTPKMIKQWRADMSKPVGGIKVNSTDKHLMKQINKLEEMLLLYMLRLNTALNDIEARDAEEKGTRKTKTRAKSKRHKAEVQL